MKVLVCFQTAPDLEKLADEDWVVDKELQLDVSFVRAELNCFDESSLEMALRLADCSKHLEADLDLTVLTVADRTVEPYLKTLNALKVDRAVRVDPVGDLRLLPEVIAAVICEYVKKHDQDVVMLGTQSGVGDNAKTGLLVAEMLGFPCISQVVNVDRVTCKETLFVSNMADGGMQRQTICPPCVLSVGNAAHAYLRVPTLKDRIEHGKRPVELLGMYDLIDGQVVDKYTQQYELRSLVQRDTRRKARPIEGGNAAEKARKLYDAVLKERLERL